MSLLQLRCTGLCGPFGRRSDPSAIGPSLTTPARGSSLGPYGSVLAYVDELSEGERLIQVSSLDLRPDDTEADMIQFSLELIAFTTATVAADEDAGPGGPGGAQLDLAFEEEGS